LVLLLGAGGLFYFSGHIQKSLEASSHAHLAKKAAALSSSSQQQEITKLALEIVDLSQSMTSELLLGIKSLAWALVGITLLQLMTIYSIYAKRKKQEIQLPGNETDCA
jgi:hypothetical protein